MGSKNVVGLLLVVWVIAGAIVAGVSLDGASTPHPGRVATVRAAMSTSPSLHLESNKSSIDRDMIDLPALGTLVARATLAATATARSINHLA